MFLAILIFASNNSLATKKKKKDTQHKIGFQLKSNLEFNWIWTLRFLHTHTYIGKTERKSNKISN